MTEGDDDDAFTFRGGAVRPGETKNFRYTVSETYLGDPVRIPVTIINGEQPGPTVFLSAAAHGDELNGIEVVREVANMGMRTGTGTETETETGTSTGTDTDTGIGIGIGDPAELAGTLVCLPVLNVPAFIAQQRYLPIYDRDLNRSFPGSETSTGSKRMAHRIFRNFIEPCDYGLDFHTSTRGRTNMLHVRANTDRESVARLANAFSTNVIISSEGPEGTLRREATEAGTPTITIEMGEAHRFQRPLIDRALEGVKSVLAEFSIRTMEKVRWPGWRTVIDTSDDKTWLRADAGGLVDMHYDRGSLVHEGDTICTIADPFHVETEEVTAPFTGLLVGVLENPLVYPGNPICHLVKLDERTRRAIELEQTARERS